MNQIRLKQLNQTELQDFVVSSITSIISSNEITALVNGYVSSGIASGISGAYPPFTPVYLGNFPVTITSDAFNQLTINFGTGYSGNNADFNNTNYTISTQTIPSGQTTYSQVSGLVIFEDLNLKGSGSFGIDLYCNRNGSGIPVNFQMMVTMFGTGWQGSTNILSGVW